MILLLEISLVLVLILDAQGQAVYETCKTVLGYVVPCPPTRRQGDCHQLTAVGIADAGYSAHLLIHLAAH